MRYLLINGLWLTAQVWDDVVRELEERGHEAVAVSLPDAEDASFTDQLDAVLAEIDASPSAVVLVGHSAAATLAWKAASERADRVVRAVLIGGMPVANGEQYAAFFPLQDGVMPFPGWAPFEGPDSDDLSDAQKSRLEQDAVSVPGGVATGVVEYASDDRYDIPVALVCPEFSIKDAKAWLAEGGMPEMEPMKHLEFVDIDTGHWPMVSAPALLADTLADLA